MRLHVGRRWRAMIVAAVLAFILVGVAGAWRLPMLQHLDLAASRDIQSIRTPWLDGFMQAATFLGAATTLFAVSFLAASGLFWFHRPREGMAAAGSILAMGLNVGLKLAANRPRPGNPVEVLTHTFGSSFPSGHAMGSAAVYGTLAAIAWSLSAQRWLVMTLVSIPVAVGVSRVYLGAHWGYDVAAGWAGGALCVSIALAWLRQNVSPAPTLSEEQSMQRDDED